MNTTSNGDEFSGGRKTEQHESDQGGWLEDLGWESVGGASQMGTVHRYQACVPKWGGRWVGSGGPAVPLEENMGAGQGQESRAEWSLGPEFVLYSRRDRKPKKVIKTTEWYDLIGILKRLVFTKMKYKGSV